MQTKAKQFEVSFVNLAMEAGNNNAGWFDLSIQAPDVFGPCCFDKGKDNDDYVALKETVESGLYQKHYREALPKIKRLAKGETPTAKDREVRERLAKVRGECSVYINRMAGYFRQANEIEADRKVRTLKDWAKGQLIALQGKPATEKRKAVPATVSGGIPNELVDLLKVLAEVEGYGTMQDYRTRVVRAHAEVKARQVIAKAATKSSRKVSVAA